MKSKESREPKHDDNEADGDDDDDDVVGLLGVLALISGLSVRVAGHLGVLGRRFSGEEEEKEDWGENEENEVKE